MRNYTKKGTNAENFKQISLLLKKIWYLKDSRNGHFPMHYSSFTLMFMLITFIFLICYIPKIVMLIVQALNPTFWEDLSDSGRAAMFFVYRMYIINNISNPFVYAFLDTQFKSNLKHLCSCCVRTCEN